MNSNRTLKQRNTKFHRANELSKGDKMPITIVVMRENGCFTIGTIKSYHYLALGYLLLEI